MRYEKFGYSDFQVKRFFKKLLSEFFDRRSKRVFRELILFTK